MNYIFFFRIREYGNIRMSWNTRIQEYENTRRFWKTGIRECLGIQEYKNTGIRDVTFAAEACDSPRAQNIRLVFLSPCLLVFFHQAQNNIRLVSLSSRFLVFHRSVFFQLIFIRNSLVGLDGLDVGVERDGRLLNLRPHVVGHVLRVVAHVVREDDVVSALLQ